MTQSFESLTINRKIRRGLRKGLTLIEAAMVLTILALVIGGVMLYYSSASTSRQISEAAGQLAATQQAVRAAYAGQSTYNGLADSVIATSLPAKMVDTSGALHHAFGGILTVASANGGGGADSGFSVTMRNLPQEGCLKLAVLDQGRTLNSISGAVAGTASAGTVPVSPATAQSGCKSGSTNTLVWTFN